MLASLVGASGAGKTTLARLLSQRGDFLLAPEQHAERPFQLLFKNDSRYALANQLDYLLFRAEQEREWRQNPRPVLTDGGLDLDFHGFTRLFHARGYLSAAEYELCRRLYLFARQALPPPDFVVYLYADEETIRRRLAARDRINIASAQDARLLDAFIRDWLATLPPEKVLRLDVSREDAAFSRSLPQILEKLRA